MHEQTFFSQYDKTLLFTSVVGQDIDVLKVSEELLVNVKDLFVQVY